MNAFPALAALPLSLSPALLMAQDHDALQSLAISDETARVLLYKSGEDAFPTQPVAARDDWAHRRGMEQLTLRPLYADFFAAHDITSTQADDIVRALAEERAFSTDWWFRGMKHSPSVEDQRAAQTVRAGLEEMLGKERFAALLDYEQTLPERRQLQKLSDWLRSLDHPLTTAQKESLVAILKSERYRLSSTLLQAPRGTPEHASEVIALHDSFDRHVRALFEPVLTPVQLEVAGSQFEDRSRRRHDAPDRYVRAMGEGSKGPFLYPAD